MSQSRFWCFTLNNPDGLIEPATFADCTYAVFQLERGSSETVHYQGYAEFTNRKRLSDVRTYLPRAHWEPRRGTQAQAIAYCTKEETRCAGPIVFGKPSESEQGRRTDLDEIRTRITKGSPEKRIAETAFGQWCRYYRSFREFRRLVTTNRNWKSEVTVLYGPPGTGKSKWALDSSDISQQYWKQRSQWWDGYEGQETVVLDDFYAWLPYDLLLRLCDRYPLMVETKGGQSNFLAKKIVITSNTFPEQWYKDVHNWSAFCRRVDQWFWVPSPGKFLFFDCFDSFKAAAITKIK